VSGLQELRVLQEDMGSDAVTFENTQEGVTYLFINPNQSFESAVKSVMRACPDLTLTEVQELIRKHCHDIVEMNARMGAAQQPIPRFDTPYDLAPVPAEDKGAHRRPRPPRWARIAAVAAPALVGGTLIAHFFSPAGDNAQGGSGNGITVSQQDTASVFDDPTYKQFVADGSLRCQPLGQYAAKCVDEDGQIMLSEASVGDSAVFTFSYDDEKIGFRVFEDASDAKLWYSEDGNRRLYDNMKIVGRVVLWGTDTKRVRDWGNALATQSSNQSSVMGHQIPQSALSALPPRLAVLALGTLGIGDTSKVKAPAGSIHAAQTLRAVELVMGLAEDDDGRGYRNVPAGPSDAVAVAADAPRPPVWGAGNGVGPSAVASPSPVTDPVSTATAPAPEPQPPAAASPAPEPPASTAPTAPAAPPPATAPPASTTPSAPASAPPASVRSEPPADITTTTLPPADATTPPVAVSEPAPAPSEPAAPTPVQPVADAPQQDPVPVAPASGELAPVDQAPADPAPVESIESVPADPAATEPAEETPAPSDAAEEDGGSDDLLILDSSWTVGA
jgi:hypothetical protein